VGNIVRAVEHRFHCFVIESFVALEHGVAEVGQSAQPGMVGLQQIGSPPPACLA